MKHLFLVFCICMQVFVASAAQAESPPGAYRSNPEALFRCLWVAAGNEDTQEEENKSETETEEEEEPDCD
jgi:hypothetical protein